MATSHPPDAAPTPPAPEPRETTLDTVAAQVQAIDQLLDLAQHHVQVFDVDMAQGGWQTAARSERVTAFLRRTPKARLDVIVHDTRWLEASCPRLLNLLRLYSHAITVYRTGPEARAAMDPLVIADGRHFLHRFHIDHPRAVLATDAPQRARPLCMRFEEIWATGEPGLNASVLGL
ncbi:MAG: hypothetical protein U1F10_00410 [Burkholderiales bacterium]